MQDRKNELKIPALRKRLVGKEKGGANLNRHNLS